MTIIDELIQSKMQTRIEVCPIHGEYVSRQYLGRIWSKCPECIRAAREEADMRERRRAWEARLGAACIPKRFQTRTLETYNAETAGQKRALAFAKDYADDFVQVLKTGRSALFIGRPGTGKTHLAVGIGLQIMRAGHTALFTTVMRAIRRVKDSWRKESVESESQAIAAMIFPDLLILDEVGVQYGSDFERNILFDILNGRYENRRPSILLSNLIKTDLHGYLGERVIDRLREDGGQVIPFDWDSYRSKR